MLKPNEIQTERIKNDLNGNPRYKILNPEIFQETYSNLEKEDIDRALKNNRVRKGSYTFQSYNLLDTKTNIIESLDELQREKQIAISNNGNKIRLSQVILRDIKVSDIDKLNKELQESRIKVDLGYMNDNETIGIILYGKIEGKEIEKFANILANNLNNGVIDLVLEDSNKKEYLKHIESNKISDLDINELNKEGYFSLNLDKNIELNIKGEYLDNGGKVVLEHVQLDMEEAPVYLKNELREKNNSPYLKVNEELQKSIEDLLRNSVILDLETNEISMAHKKNELEVIKNFIVDEINNNLQVHKDKENDEYEINGIGD